MRLVLAALALALAAAPVAARAAVVNDETAHCASLGAKRPGTAADRAMADHLEQRFRAAGLETSIEYFHLPVFTRARAVASRSPRRGALRRHGRDVRLRRRRARSRREVVDVGAGRASDYNGKDARGKIVMVDRNEAFHRSSQLNEVVDARRRGDALRLRLAGQPRPDRRGALRPGHCPRRSRR